MILFLAVVPGYSNQCDGEDKTCAALMGLLNKGVTDPKNFYIYGRRDINDKYEAVVLYSWEGDSFGLFVVDKRDFSCYMTLALLPSRRGHDYRYKISGVGVGYIDLEGAGDTYGDQEIKHRFFFDLEKKQVLAGIPYNDIALGEMVRHNGELFFVGAIDYSHGLIFRLKSLAAEDGNYDYSVISENDGEKLGPITGIEREDGELRFVSKNKSYVLGKEGKFRTEFLPKIRQVKIEPNGIRLPSETGGQDGFWVVPLLEPKLFEKYRPEMVKNGSMRAMPENLIGPWVIFGDNLWFGFKFYDGEGTTGLGGYGVFDVESMTAEIKYSTETAPWSASAIFVDDDRVCMGLYRQPEGAAYPAGLFCENRKTRVRQIYKIPQIVNSIEKIDGALVLGTSNGLFVVHHRKIESGKFSVNKDGSYRMDFTESAP